MAFLIQLTDGEGGIKLPINKPKMTIGRHSENDISIDDELVSKEHAVLEVMLKSEKDASFSFYLQDLNSTNHTFVNDQMIGLHQLKDGDVIRIGGSNFRFVDDPDGDLDETAKLYKTWIPGVFYTGKKKR